MATIEEEERAVTTPKQVARRIELEPEEATLLYQLLYKILRQQKK